jgi:gluconate 5-dehydrogenase
MAVELAPHHIRVNAIAPGFIHDGFGRGMTPERIKSITDVQPADRLGTAMEIGAAAVYLASDASGYTTGEIMVVDGGYSLQC